MQAKGGIKVGIFNIEFGEFKGFVKEIQIFHTVLITYNNEKIVIPNGGLSTGSINNFSAEKYHRLEWRVSISYGDSVEDARNAIMGIIKADKRIIKNNNQVHEDKEQQNTTLTTNENTEQKTLPWWRRIFKKKKDDHDVLTNLPNPTHEPGFKRDYTPYVAVESMSDSAVILITRAWCKTKNYWEVLYAINEEIYNTLPKHGLHFPFPQMDIHVKDKI